MTQLAPSRPSTAGGAENRSAPGDPLDGGWITPICRLNDTQGEAVRAGISVLRQAGVRVLHYTHTRLGYWPNGTEVLPGPPPATHSQHTFHPPAVIASR